MSKIFLYEMMDHGSNEMLYYVSNGEISKFMMFSNVVTDISSENNFRVIKDRFSYERVNSNYQLTKEEVESIQLKILQATFL